MTWAISSGDTGVLIGQVEVIFTVRAFAINVAHVAVLWTRDTCLLGWVEDASPFAARAILVAGAMVAMIHARKTFSIIADIISFTIAI